MRSDFDFNILIEFPNFDEAIKAFLFIKEQMFYCIDNPIDNGNEKFIVYSRSFDSFRLTDSPSDYFMKQSLKKMSFDEFKEIL